MNWTEEQERAIKSRDKNLFIMKDSLSIPIKVRSKTKIIEQFTQYQISRIRGGVRI